MNYKSRIVVKGALLLIVSLALISAGFARPIPSNPRNLDGGRPLPVPSPLTYDQIIHNVGNISTTVDNYGYIGGYSYYGLPSGEWPRGSGHNYIGEIKYWMGATTATGDTAVSNTEDDFQAVPSIVSGVDDYKILLSTDSTRYWNFDRSDTVGLGRGNPAHGWREFNLDSNSWVYSTNYSPIDSQYFRGGPVALQESHFVFDDNATGTPPLGVEVTHTMLQWNYSYNEDITFVILDIKNTSSHNYADFAFALYVDIDVGGPDGTGENGRLGDLFASDSAENLAWIYDADGYDPGWGRLVTTGVMGTKLLETPDNIGVTGLRSGDWNALSDINDAGRYAMITARVQDTSLPPTDQYYIQCTAGIDLTAGKTVRVVYALIAGADEADFRSKAARAQMLYDNHFVGPQPPITPILSVRPGDRKVYLHWSDTSEVGPDPLTGTVDFVGYKLYRSDDLGKSWGKLDSKGQYMPISVYAINDPGDPIQHSYIDTGIYNGVEYWYCLAAFDRLDPVSGIGPLQSGFGVPGVAQNVVGVRSRSNPAGGFEAAGTVTHEYTGSETPSQGQVVPIVFSPDSLHGTDYAVVFEDTPSKTYWHLIDVTNGDTVLARQTIENADPGLYNVAQGLRVVVDNSDRWPSEYGQVLGAGQDTTLSLLAFLGPSTVALFGMSTYGDAHYRSTYELRWTGDSTMSPNVAGAGYVLYNVPYEVWNTTTNQRVSLAIYDASESGVWTPRRWTMIVNYPYNPADDLFASAFPDYFSWIYRFDTSTYAPANGDVFRFAGAPVNGPSDRFVFKADGVNATVATADLKKIRVVPDPYFESSMAENAPGKAYLEFTKLPDRCTIRIYTLTGDLVKTIEHNGAGTEAWDLQSSNAERVASGVYLFHVDSPYGQRIGRFAVIK
jgi:hypothetical protein